MPSAEKIALKSTYDALLKERSDFILTRYSGLDVAQLTSLRKKLSDKGVKYTVVKNNVFRVSLESSGLVKDFPYDSTLKGPLAIAFVKSDLPVVAKVLKDFSKENEKFQITAGVMEAAYYDKNGVSAIAELPSKEQILAQIAAMVNSPATKIAGVLNNVMASLARGIRAAAEKNG